MTAEPILSDFVAARIRTRRRALGLSTQGLADQCGISYSVLVNIETGRPGKTGHRRRHITIEELVMFEKALGIPLMDRGAACEACNGEPPTGFQCTTCGAAS